MTGIVNVTPGAIVSIGEPGAYVVCSFESPTQARVRDMVTGVERGVELTELRLTPTPSRILRPDLASLSEKQFQEAKQKYLVIKPLIDVNRCGADAIRAAALSANVSPATIYRWLKEFREGYVMSNIIRKSRSDVGKSRLTDVVESIVADVISEYWMTEQKRSYAKAHREVQRRCRKANVRPPSLPTLVARANRINPQEVAHKRHGKAAADKFNLIDGTVPNVSRPYSVIQIDHTLVDIELVDSEHRVSIGRPWITVAIDVYSRMVVGWYYIHKTRPFFVSGRVYYEVTFCRAVNKVNKFDRIIAFTRIDMTDKYSAMLTLQRDSIDVLDQTMPITIIRDWKVSIRPCEFDNFSRLLGKPITVRTNSVEYQFLMGWLTESSGSLVDLIDMPSGMYASVREAGTKGAATKLQIFPILDEVRRIASSAQAGQNILRYLILRMHNQILKPLYDPGGCHLLPGMKLPYSCIPFDTMPFCTSLPRHNPRYWDLVESLDVTGRNHELFARRVKNNVERHGILYTAVNDLEAFGDVNNLISAHNNELYHKHTERRLVHDMKHVFSCGYENETVAIVEKLQTYASSRIDGYAQAVERWLNETSRSIDDSVKVNALKQLFSQSRVALIYGAAGTGKSTMVDHIAHYFADKQKLFLAHTHPATDNLKRKVPAPS